MNSDRRVVESRVYITRSKHGKFLVSPLLNNLVFFCVILEMKYELFFPYIDAVISTFVEFGKTR